MWCFPIYFWVARCHRLLQFTCDTIEWQMNMHMGNKLSGISHQMDRVDCISMATTNTLTCDSNKCSLYLISHGQQCSSILSCPASVSSRFDVWWQAIALRRAGQLEWIYERDLSFFLDHNSDLMLPELRLSVLPESLHGKCSKNVANAVRNKMGQQYL